MIGGPETVVLLATLLVVGLTIAGLVASGVVSTNTIWAWAPFGMGFIVLFGILVGLVGWTYFRMPTDPSVDKSPVVRSTWDLQLEQAADAAIYVDPSNAIDALANRTVDLLNECRAGSAVLRAGPSGVDGESKRAVESIESALTKRGIQVVASDAANPHQPIVTIEARTKSAGQQNEQFGALAREYCAVCDFGDRQQSIEIACRPCEWLRDFAKVNAAQSGRLKCIVVELTTDDQELVRQALANEERKLVVEKASELLGRRIRDRVVGQTWNELQADRSALGIERDRFLQYLKMDGRPIARGAVLVDMKAVESLADRIATTEKANSSMHLLAVIGMFGIVAIGYYAVDIASRGHFRTVVAVLFVVGLITIGVIWQ